MCCKDLPYGIDAANAINDSFTELTNCPIPLLAVGVTVAFLTVLREIVIQILIGVFILQKKESFGNSLKSLRVSRLVLWRSPLWYFRSV